MTISLWHVITQSVCFEFLMIVPLIVICVCDVEFYTLFENLQYHLIDFVTQIWYKAVTLILSYVLIIETDFDSHTLRACYLSERLQPPGFESEICFGLWHSSLPFYCLSTVYVSWAGLWVAVRTAPGTRSAYTIPKDPTTRVWIWNTWQAVI